ncbi:MAG: class I SAM-dependent methyltransferase [Alphaproteobacteria bacterium]|nr:class I SAM-dependent methyltransferase [Alphaproteobacteria bacterium]
MAHEELRSNSDDDFDRFRFRRGLELLSSVAGKIPADALWLDLGCNQGQFLEDVIATNQVKGIGFDNWDPAPKAPHDIWRYLKADLDKALPWSEPADFVSALEVLEHMIDTDGFLRRMHAALKPKGWLLISTPNINCLRNRITVPLGAYPAGLEYRNIVHHVRLYNVGTLTGHLREHGFEKIAVSGVSFLPLSSSLGTGRLSERLADMFPSLCNNLLVVAQKP